MGAADGDDFLNYLQDTLVQVLAEAENANHAAELLRDRVVNDWGGQAPYITKGKKWQRDRRDHELYVRFNGSNRLELCREYGISSVRLYRIINEQHAKRQHDLFTGANAPKDTL